MKHRPECIRAHAIYDFIVGYFAQWFPDYCRHCNGWGGFYSTYDPSPAGVSLGSGHMEEYDPCPHCLEKSKCPRCGSQDQIDIIDHGDDVFHCGICNWDSEEPDGLPSPPECNCESFCEECGEWLGLFGHESKCKHHVNDPKREKVREYLRAPFSCPWCGSDDIQGRMLEIDSDLVWCDVECNTCEHIWREDYHLFAISWEGNDSNRRYSDEDLGVSPV